MWQHILSQECRERPVAEVNMSFNEKAVRYHWLKVSQKAWQLATNPIKSARQFVAERGQENMIALLDVKATPGTTVLTFKVTDFVDAWAKNTCNLAMDSTCKL
jgi:hypothetical protein